MNKSSSADRFETPELVSEEDLLTEVVSQDNPELRVKALLEVSGALMNGTRKVVSSSGDELAISIVFENLLRSLDTALRYELIAWTTQRAKECFGEPHSEYGVDEIVVSNLLATASVILPGQAIYRKLLSYSRQALLTGSLASPAVRLESARLLYDANDLGNSQQFWAELCGQSLSINQPLSYVALCALMHKWPRQSLSFILELCIGAPDNVQKGIASLIAVLADDVTSGVSFEQYSQAYVQYNFELSDEVRKALLYAAERRGWTLSQELGLVPMHQAIKANGSLSIFRSDALTFPLTHPPSVLTREPNAESAVLLGDFYGMVHHSNRRGQLYQDAFPEAEIAAMREMRPYNRPELDGLVHMSYVRRSVEQQIEEEGELGFAADEEPLLRAVDKHAHVHSHAKKAAAALSGLGFKQKPLVLGASEFHQDRLLMSIAAAALRRAQLLGVSVAKRSWAEPTFMLGNSSGDAHVLLRAHLVDAATRAGVFKFSGFRVFARVDALKNFLATSATKELVPSLEKLIHAVESGEDPRGTMPVRIRANIVLHLGEMEGKGSAFEDLRSAIANVAGVADTRRPGAVSVSNDKVFEDFMTGRARMYCGGAINNLLIQTWWEKSLPGTFVELLNHEEIAQGFRIKRKSEWQPAYVENQIECNFGERSKDVNKARHELVLLFRAIGRGLQGWSHEVMSHPANLNGTKDSCVAARRILRPLPKKWSGHWAFATRLTDAAKLTILSDRYYEDSEGLAA